MPSKKLPTIHIYQAHAQKKIPLTTKTPGKVNLYACGMTVYDYCHAGHARVMIFFDLVKQYLEHRGYKVTYVRNITDIDDKIIARAEAKKQPWQALTEEFIQAMHEDCAALGVGKPDHEPKATDYIEHMIALIQKLIDNKAAYVTPSGDVCFRISAFKNYGALSNRKLEDMRSGARVDVQEDKEDPLDFILWKQAKPEEPNWPSPWGAGRPGWHIECSTMSTKLLGHDIDIHGGGIDLKFPHHENEIAQSEAAYNKPFVRHWMHVGHIQVNKEKMSKSLGNFFTIREVLKQYHPEVIRYFMLMRHYRSPLDYTPELIDEAKHILSRWYQTLRTLDLDTTKAMQPDAIMPTEEAKAFYQAMDDDFNTPLALSVLTNCFHQANQHHAKGLTEQAEKQAALGKTLAASLGLLQIKPETFLTHAVGKLDKNWVESMIEQRAAARTAKDFATADKIRDDLLKAGIELDDTASGTVWKTVQ
jgi:cysteinyl-tRNA synthetase